MPDTRTCKRCGKSKPVSEFPSHERKRKDSREVCLACHRARAKEHKHRYNERVRYDGASILHRPQINLRGFDFDGEHGKRARREMSFSRWCAGRHIALTDHNWIRACVWLERGKSAIDVVCSLMSGGHVGARVERCGHHVWRAECEELDVAATSRTRDGARKKLQAAVGALLDALKGECDE